MENIAIAGSPKTIKKMNLIKPGSIYQFGSQEFHYAFPFSLLTTNYQSKILSGPQLNNNSVKVSSDSVGKGKLMKTFLQVSHFLGIYHLINRHSISPQFLEWVKRFNPDYIYSQLSTLPLINLVYQISTDLQKEVVVHFMDDWPSSINRTGLFKHYWDHHVDKKLRQLLDQSSVRVAISEKMAFEYGQRYGGEWRYFHNPVDIERWKSIAKTKLPGKELRILYSGRIGLGNQNSIKQLSDALKEWNGDIKIHLDIVTPEYQYFDNLQHGNCTVKKPFPYDKLPEIWTKYDLMYLPQDFDVTSLRFIKYSIPTKLTEYMITGVPILLHAPQETALFHYASRHNIAYLNNADNPAVLLNTLLDLLGNEQKYQSISKRAIQIAREKHNATAVQSEFREIFEKPTMNETIVTS